MVLWGKKGKGAAKAKAAAEATPAAAQRAAEANAELNAHMAKHPVDKSEGMEARLKRLEEMCKDWPNNVPQHEWCARVFGALEREHKNCTGEIKIYCEGPGPWPMMAKCGSCSFRMEVFPSKISTPR